MYAIDLNSDLGESFGAYTIGRDKDILPLVSSANVACGFHAGDPTIMAKTAAYCKESGTAIGAHPGFADLQGFGRRNMQLSPEDAKHLVIYQVGALDAFCKSEGISLQHVKPHGALYNMAAKDAALAKAICEGIYTYNPSLILLGLANSEMLRAAREIGLPHAAEVFADRAYEDDGTLVARSKPGAMIHDEDLAVSRVIRMIKNRTVTTVSGREIEICPDSVCVHGDSEKALLFVKKIRSALEKEGIAIKPIAQIITERA
ncbi:MAG: LamB/YcsF family protein [Ruminococcaceae bacterium]|nr:LamB/YcsF family protein [Oscillospiraceae bacterium]